MLREFENPGFVRIIFWVALVVVGAILMVSAAPAVVGRVLASL
jgi:hypothetical protein